MGMNLRFSPLEYQQATNAFDFGGARLDNYVGAPYDLAGPTYHVSRNVAASGDGLSWAKAFKTIGEAVTIVNTAYTASAPPTKGRNWRIVVGEGWYGETTITLSASDGYIIGVGAGNMARSVLYGSLTPGGFDDGNVGAALKITGANNTIANMDFVNRSATISGVYNNAGSPTEHPCIVEGTYLVPVYYNRYVNCGFMRDQPDAASWGIISYSADHTLIENCTFNGRSLKLGGVSFSSGTGTNHSADVVRNNYFYGTPTGIYQNSSHNTWIHHNFFADQGATSETITAPCNIAGGTAYMFYNFSPDTTEADFNSGASGIEKANICSDTDEASFPAAN